MDIPTVETMQRSDDIFLTQVEHYHTSTRGTSFGVWAPNNQNDLPVVIFQSGYGSNSKSHATLLSKIASAGFLVIAPDQDNDLQCGCLGAVGFLSGVSCASMATDGSQIGKALEYLKNTDNKWMDRIDLNQLSVIGFSMGGQEVIHAKARYPNQIKAIVVLSGSVMLPLATAIGWNPCCYPCSGGSCTLCSDTPVGLWGLGRALRSWDVPSLFITSERDMAKAGVYRAADIAGGNSTLITFKDEALNLDIPHTKKTTIWGCFAPFTCYGGPFYGKTTFCFS